MRPSIGWWRSGSSRPTARTGLFWTGIPRTVQQAKLLAELLVPRPVRTMVVHLVVDYNVIVARISGRRQCPVCGSLVWNKLQRAEDSAGVCDKDGAKLVVRDDDREEVVRERLRAYEQQTAPVLAFFKKSGIRCWDVAAAGDPSAGDRARNRGADPERARRSSMIVRKNMAELEKMRAAGLLVWKILDELAPHGGRRRFDLSIWK